MKRLLWSKIAFGLLFGCLSRLSFEILRSKSYSNSILHKRCSPCEDASKVRGVPCPFCGAKSVLASNEQSPINEPYKPRGMYEITRWLYFDQRNLYDIIDGEPVVALVGGTYEETRAVTQVALEYINANEMLGKTWELESLQDGYMRTDALRGTDYMLDLNVKSKEKYQSESVKATLRVKMVHPFQPKKDSISLVSNKAMPDMGIHLFALASGTEESLERFVKRYTELRAKDDRLTLALFDGKGEFGDESGTLKPHLDELIRRYPTSGINSIDIPGDYSFLNALHQGVKSADDSVILTLKIDMHYGHELLQRCRMLTVLNRRVYFPTAFGQYDPEIIEKGMPTGKPKNVNKMDITKFTGYWMRDTHDFACAHSRDLSQAVDKLLLSRSRATDDSISNTDVGKSLFDLFLSENFDVITSVEPDLIRLFRKINCDMRFLPDGEYEHCLQTAAKMLGSKPAMSMVYLTEIAMRKL